MESQVGDPILAKLNGQKKTTAVISVDTTDGGDPILDKLNGVKKKGNAAVSPGSSDATSIPGSEDSSTPSEQGSKPTESPTEEPPVKQTLGNKILGNIFEGAFALGKKAISTIKDEMVGSYYTEKAIEKKTDFIDELIRTEPEKYRVANEYASPEARRQYAEKQALIEYGNDLPMRKRAYNAQAMQEKQADLAEAAKQKAEGEEFTKGIPKSWDEAVSSGKISEYIGSAIGNGLAQIPLSIATLGTSSYFMEKTGAYDEAVQAIAEHTGETPEKIIEQGRDKPAKDIAHIVGLVNGAIDLGSSAFTIGKGIGQGVKNIVKKKATEEILKSVPEGLLGKSAKAVAAPLVEYGTEFWQGTNSQIGALIAGGKKLEDIDFNKDIDWARSREEGLQGLFGSMGVIIGGKAISPSQVVSEQHIQVKDTGDLGKAAEVADRIQEAVNNTTDENITKPTVVNNVNTGTSDVTTIPSTNEGTGQPTSQGTGVAADVATTQGATGQVNTGVQQTTQPTEGVTNDSENKPRISGQERVGQEPLQTESKQGTGGETVGTGGVVQKTSEKEADLNQLYEGVKNDKWPSKEHIDNLASKYGESEVNRTIGRAVVDKPKQKITAKKSEEDQSGGDVGTLLKKLDESDNYDVSDLADDIEGLDSDHPKYDELQKAVKKYRDQNQESKDVWGQRDDQESYANDFEKEVRSINSKARKDVKDVAHEEVKPKELKEATKPITVYRGLRSGVQEKGGYSSGKFVTTDRGNAETYDKNVGEFTIPGDLKTLKYDSKEADNLTREFLEGIGEDGGGITKGDKITKDDKALLFQGESEEAWTDFLKKKGYDATSSINKSRTGRPSEEIHIFDSSKIKKKKSPTQKVFVYGTLRDKGTRFKALGEHVETTEHTLPGMTKMAGEYSTIKPGSGEVKGQMMELTPEQVEKLDKYEKNYDRKEVQPGVFAYVRKEDVTSKGNKKSTLTPYERSIKKYADLESATPRVGLLKFFATGGKVNLKEAMERTGLKAKDLASFTSDKGVSWDRLTERVKEESYQEDADEGDIRDQIDYMITRGRKDITEELDKHIEEGQAPPELSKVDQAKQQLRDRLGSVKTAFDELGTLGAVFDPEQQAAKLLKLHNELVALAKDAINLGIETVEQFAEVIGRNVDENIKKAWREVKPRKYAIAERIEKSNVNPAIKRGIKEVGDRYIPKGLDITNAEADALLELYEDDIAEKIIRDLTNSMTPDTRTALTAKLYQKYVDEGENDKAVDIAMWQAEQSMQAGRASNAAKIWKMITQSGEDNIVLAIEKEQGRQVQNTVEPVRQELNKTREQLDAEIKLIIEQKVQEGVKERLGRAKLITQEKKKEISAFFDNLRAKTPKGGMMLSSPIPIAFAVWNGALDIIEAAVLTGASVANAIDSAIDYIKTHHKADFDEAKARQMLTPDVEKVVPVEASKVNQDKIDVPKLTGRKKKEFIDEVVGAHNDGKLTDKKFDELYAKKLGVKELSTQDRNKIRELAKTISEAEKFEDVLKKDFTPENIKKHKKLVDLAQKANTQLQEFATDTGTIPDTLIAIMQAGVMSSMSLVSNPYYNLVLQPLRFAETGLASMLDFSMSGLAKIGLLSKAQIPRTIDMAALQKGYFKSGWNGFVEGAKQLKTGQLSDERNLREISSKFNPGRAWERMFNGDKDRTRNQKINDFIEGTIGWPAELVFRTLNFGDKPWKQSAQGAKAYEIGTLKGLKGKELEQFMMLPDEESAAKILQAGQDATFQQSTKGGKWVQNMITSGLNLVEEKATETFGSQYGPFVGGAAKVLLKSQALFVKTPYNMVSMTIDFAAPPLTFARGVIQLNKGNRREGLKLIGRSMLGTMLWGAITKVFVAGLMTGDDDKEEKKRRFQQDSPVPPANSINMSAMRRISVGEGPSIQDGDRWVSYTKMGVFGVLCDVYSNVYKDRISKGQPLVGGPNPFVVDVIESVPKVISSTLEQTFLQGTSTALDALTSGDQRKQDQWLIKTAETVGTILYPNTIAAIGKASDTYNRDVQDPDFVQHLANTFKAKMFMSESLPAKVSIWGDKITGNPEGRNKYAYYLFDPTKFKDVDTDDYRYKLYEKFKTDYDSDWLPSQPKREITYNGEPLALTPKQYEQFCIYVGQQRAALLSAYVNQEHGLNKANAEIKEDLADLYKEGRDLGQKQFLINNGYNVKWKFTPPRSIRNLQKDANTMRKKAKGQ